MKKIALFLMLFAFIFASSSVSAQKYEIGADVAVKVQYLRFMDSIFEDANARDGVFIGLEAYKQLFVPNLYFGVETGWGGTRGGFNDVNGLAVFRTDLEVNYVPIEFNAKYVFEINPCLFFGLGGGISYNYMDIEVRALGLSGNTNEWLFGGQFFAELNYRFTPNFFAGVAIKYQLTEDMKLFGVNTNASADNLRVGMQLGYNF